MTIDVLPITGTIGAEIKGVDPATVLDSATIATVRDALLRHLVLVFRNVTITPEQQIAFARYFGEIQEPPLRTKFGEYPEINVLDQSSGKGDADRWHNDNTYTATPAMGSVLHVVKVSRARAVTRASPTCTPRTTRCHPGCASWSIACAPSTTSHGRSNARSRADRPTSISR